MLTVAEVLRARQTRSGKPDENELRSLPYGRAFVYGRLSSPAQVRDSRESVREIAKLIELAQNDGYRTNLVPAEIEAQLLSGGAKAQGLWEDGEVTVDARDLGISGQLPAEARKGLAHLQKEIQLGNVGAVYLGEGVSRLSRDQDRILPYQLLKLLKVKQVRVRTPDGVWNPAILRDWDYLAEEFEDASDELRVMGKRMYRRKKQKAARGEFVGEPIPPGFFLPITGRKANGQYEYARIEPYPPHAEIVQRVLEEFIKTGGSKYKTAQSLKNVTFPYFPEDMRYMERLTSLRACPRRATGYGITASLIRGLATNLKLIGMWWWGDGEPIQHNHKAAVPEELFLRAYELAATPSKPRGRTVHFEPMEWSGLLWCMNHPQPVRVSNHSAKGYYQCDRDYEREGGQSCFSMSERLLNEPLTSSVLGHLDFTPYVDEVLSQMETAAREGKLQHSRDRQAIVRLEQETERWKSLLPGCVDDKTKQVDREREDYYWTKIHECQTSLDELKRKPVPDSTLPVLDFPRLKEFLKGLPESWPRYNRISRNRLLKLVIERVELSGTSDIEATIIWKTGFQQKVFIQRMDAWRNGRKRWTPEEDAVLKSRFASSPQAAIQAALPRRSWDAITERALVLRLKRKSAHEPVLPKRPWTSEDDEALKTDYEAGRHLADIAARLHRSVPAINVRASIMKLERPRRVKWHKADVVWHNDNNLIPLQVQSSE